MPPLAPQVLVIGHRGAPALRPEHTLASYARAVADGADFIEPDLVPSKDGILVARHESDITQTTDVSSRPEFADRRTTRIIDGQEVEGWFTIDFSLLELKTLRARERLPQVRQQNTRYDGLFQIPTFEEIMDFLAAESEMRGRPVGLIPEIKNSTFFASVGLPVEDRFVAALDAHAAMRSLPVEIQSFEIDNLRALRRKLGSDRPNVRLLQLVGPDQLQPADVIAAGGRLTFGDMKMPRGLESIRRYADGIGPATRAIIPLGSDGKLDQTTSLVHDAHQAGLLVHPYTFRPENMFLAVEFRNQARATARNPEGSVQEIRRYIEAGVDGFFTDDPALGRRALDGT